MADGILYWLNLNWSIVGSRSPLTFKTKLFVTTVNNSFQPLAPSKMLCRAWIEYCNMIQKNSKKYQVSPPLPHSRIVECNLEKIWKTHPPRCPKNTFPEVFHIKSSILQLISNGLNEFSINSMRHHFVSFHQTQHNSKISF